MNLKTVLRWAGEWIETLRVAPPFSRRRRDLLATLRDDEPENWIEVARPEASPAPCVHDGGAHCLRGTPGCDCPLVTSPADPKEASDG